MKKLVLGLAFASMGTFAMAQQAPVNKERKAKMEYNYQQKMEEMQKELNLTDAQMNQMKALHEKRKAERNDTMKKSIEQRNAKKEAHKAEMKAILTPEQYQKWEAKRAEKMKASHEKMKVRKDMMQKPVKN